MIIWKSSLLIIGLCVLVLSSMTAVAETESDTQGDVWHFVYPYWQEQTIDNQPNVDIKEIKAFCQMKAQDGINREILNITTINWDLESIRPILMRKEVKTNDNILIKSEEWHVTTRMRILASLFNKFSIKQTLNLFQKR